MRYRFLVAGLIVVWMFGFFLLLCSSHIIGNARPTLVTHFNYSQLPFQSAEISKSENMRRFS